MWEYGGKLIVVGLNGHIPCPIFMGAPEETKLFLVYVRKYSTYKHSMYYFVSTGKKKLIRKWRRPKIDGNFNKIY